MKISLTAQDAYLLRSAAKRIVEDCRVCMAYSNTNGFMGVSVLGREPSCMLNNLGYYKYLDCYCIEGWMREIAKERGISIMDNNFMFNHTALTFLSRWPEQDRRDYLRAPTIQAAALVMARRIHDYLMDQGLPGLEIIDS